jgi:hypothetical protein
MIAELMTGILLVVGAAVVIVLVIAMLTVLRAFVLCKLWTWFIVPFFHLPELTIPFAIGIALVAGMFYSHLPPDDDKKVQFWTVAFTGPLIILFVGWIVQMFI